MYNYNSAVLQLRKSHKIRVESMAKCNFYSSFLATDCLAGGDVRFEVLNVSQDSKV